MKKMYIVYMSYPYSEDPDQTTEEVKGCAQILLNEHDDLVLLVPHFVFDQLWAEDGKLPEGYTHPEIAIQELALIHKVDIFAYDPRRVSSGVRWEMSFAEYMQIPILTFEELLAGKRPSWRDVLLGKIKQFVELLRGDKR